MQILVTGGTGFIGSRLVRRLLSEGHRVSVVSRQDAKDVRQQLSTDVRPIGAISAVNPSVAYDAIINLAGAGIMDRRWTNERKRELLDSRVGLTNELVDLIERMENKPKLLLSGSAIGYYGTWNSLEEQPGKGDESMPEGSDFAASLCHRWEQAAMRATGMGVRVCTVRTGVVLHPDGGALGKMTPAFNLGLGGPMGNGRQMMSWIHMDDMVEALLFLLHSPDAEGAYNATAPNPVNNRKFVRCLGAALKRPAVIPVPAVVLRMGLGESAEMLLKGQSVVPVRLLDAGFQFSHRELQSALEALFGD